MNFASSAFAAHAMPDGRYPDVIQLQHASVRPPSSGRAGRGLRMGGLCGRPLGSAVLAVTTFTLAVLAGPDLIGHLLGAGDADHCPVCAAVHGMRAGAPTATVVLVPALLLVGPPTLRCQSSVPAVARSSPSSRAPPAIA
jgi:hypothetical protein